MKLKNFKNKFIAILILSVAFVIGMNAQSCGTSFSNTDIKNLNCTLKNDTLHVKSSDGIRQGTLDSIRDALYSPLGHSPLTAANYLQSMNVIMTDIYDSMTVTKIFVYKNDSVAGLDSVEGAQTFYIANIGSDFALFNNKPLPSGTSINLNLPAGILPRLYWDSLSSHLLITYVK